MNLGDHVVASLPPEQRALLLEHRPKWNRKRKADLAALPKQNLLVDQADQFVNLYAGNDTRIFEQGSRSESRTFMQGFCTIGLLLNRSAFEFLTGVSRAVSLIGLAACFDLHVFQLLLREELEVELASIDDDQEVQFRRRQLAGEGHKYVVDGKVMDEGILIEPYKAHLKGPEYCLKSMNDCHGEWDSRWLRMFHPGIRSTAKPSHRTVRQERRFQEEKERFSDGFGTRASCATVAA